MGLSRCFFFIELGVFEVFKVFWGSNGCVFKVYFRFQDCSSSFKGSSGSHWGLQGASRVLVQVVEVFKDFFEFCDSLTGCSGSY